MRQVRLFTRVEAERTLPLVRRIVADIQREYGNYSQAMRRYDQALDGIRMEWGEAPGRSHLWEEAMVPARIISGYLHELDMVGCTLKEFRNGTVDFPSLRGDRVVLLCWCVGEERITHWHEVDAGYGGRQPIDHTPFSEVLS